MTTRKILSLVVMAALMAVFMLAAPNRASADGGRYWYRGNGYQYYQGGHSYRHLRHHRFWPGHRPPHVRFYSPYYRYPYYRPYTSFGYSFR
jgi:hypothetical protein